MTRTCGTCGHTWAGTATFCGWCGDLLDTSLGRRRPPRATPWWLHPGVLAAVAIGFVAGVVAAVPTLSIATDRGVDGQIGLPDDPEDVPAGTTSALPPPPAAPQASTSSVTCVVPTDCMAWHRQVEGVVAEFVFGSPPRAIGDPILTVDGNSVAAYDLADGQRRWHRSYGMGAVRLLGWDEHWALLTTDVLSMSLVDLTTGDPVWDVPVGGELNGDIFVGDMVLTTGTFPSAGTTVRALDVATGDLVWEWESPWTSLHVPRADAGAIVIQSQDGGQAELDPVTGAARSVSAPALSEVGAQPAHVAVRDDLAVVVHWDETRFGTPELRVDVNHVPSGELVWTHPATSEGQVAVVDEVVIFATRVDERAARQLQAHDLTTGEIRWSQDVPAGTAVWANPESVATGPPQSVVVEEGTTVRRLNPLSGDTLWDTDLSRAGSSWATIDEDLVVIDAQSTVSLLDLDTGEELLVAELQGGRLIDVDPPVVYDHGLGTLTVLRLP